MAVGVDERGVEQTIVVRPTGIRPRVGHGALLTRTPEPNVPFPHRPRRSRVQLSTLFPPVGSVSARGGRPE